MSNKLNKVTKLFEGDLTDWKPIPFWSWNDRLEPEELCRQIDWMNENGIGGFFMHARGGLKTEYLSDEWMKCIETSAEHALKLGMNAWAYDENGWPSGFAGGKLLEDPDNRDCYLTTSTGLFDPDADVSYLLDSEELIRVSSGEAGKEYLNLFIHTAVSTADILNPEVVEKFIALTHEAYKKQLNRAFNSLIHGFFTDEPQYQRWHTPFTKTLYRYFEEQYNEDILDSLGLLFVEKQGFRRFRHRYWKAMQQLMLNSFAKKIYEWCHNNGVKLTGHYIEETNLAGQMLCCAGIMPFYAYMDIPGIDWLGSHSDNVIPPRQLASVAAQFGKKHTLTETFACCGWQISPRDLKRVADFQFLGGVNMLCHHLVPYAEYGQRKKDHPAHYSPVNPWVEREFSDFNLYYTRLGRLLSESVEKINVAVLHPIQSAYLDYKRDIEGSISELDQNFFQDCRLLVSSGIPFHFLDETLLEDIGFVNGDRIGCGKCEYEYLILPHIINMDASTERLLHEYVMNGGKVMIMGDAPSFCEGERNDYSYLSSNCELEEIINTQPFQISPCSTDIYIYNSCRELDGEKFLFIQNGTTDKPYTLTYSFDKDIHSFRKLDLLTLEEKNIPLTVTLEPGESILVFPNTAEPDQLYESEEHRFVLNNAEVSFEANQLTVDFASYSLDGKNYSRRYPCEGLFAKLLKERYEGEIYLKYEFDIRTLPKHIYLEAEDCGAEQVWLNGRSFSFDDRSAKEKKLLKADISDLVNLGINEFVIKLNWYQSENVYYALFGENVTESLKNCLVYDTELEPIYLLGDFGVYSESGFMSGKAPGYVCADDFYIGKAPKTVTEPVTDGFPFFAGKMTVRQKILLKDSNVTLRLEGTWHAAYITINGKYAGKLVYDRTIFIGDYAVEGENLVEIELTIGNRNLLGPHHNVSADLIGVVSPASFTCETENWEDGKNPSYIEQYSFIKLSMV